MTKQQIKSVPEAIQIIKELQSICKKQREKIRDLEHNLKIERMKYKKPSAEENLGSFGDFIRGFSKNK